MSFTDFKEVTTDSTGTVAQFGGRDINEIMKILNGEVVANRRPQIANPWIFIDSFDVKAPGSAPSAPTDSSTNRLYTDPSDLKLKVRKTAGTIVDLEAGANAGDVFLGSANTHGDFDNTFRSSRLILRDSDNSNSYILAGSNLGTNRTVTFPLLTGNDIFVTEAFAQTLTNKTVNVDANTIKHSTTNVAGDLLKGNATSFQRFAKGTALQFLRVNAGGTDLEWANVAGGGDVMLGATNTYGDFDSIFRSSRVKIRNPANTFSYSLVGAAIAAARNITLPLLTADDTAVTQAFAQPLTNKTIDASTNTVSNIGDAQHSTHTTTKISTLSKSLLNTAIVYNDQNNSLGAFYHDVSQISAPANPGAGVRRIYLDSASGKLSVKTSAGGIVTLENTMPPDIGSGGSIWGLWTGGARQGTGMFSNAALVTGTNISSFQGTNTSDQITTDFATGAVIGNLAGFQGPQPTQGGFYTARNQNFRFKCKLQCDALTNRRVFIGFAGLNTLPTATDTYLATAIPGFGFRYSSGTDTTWKILRNDASGTAVTVDSGITPVANTPDTLEIIADEAGTRIGWSINGSAVTYYTTDVPTTSIALNYFHVIETKSAAAQRLRIYYSYLTQAGV